ncbi:MAG: HAD family phosphatase [Candidatus Omnitrophica bacterium]|nr:HAD family phosphatase [Candidatus Omnitrophota bacterium]
MNNPSPGNIVEKNTGALPAESLRIKSFIFDLGRVLIDFDHLRAAERIARYTVKTPEQIYRLFFDSALTQAFEEGRLSPEEFYGEVKKALAIDIDYQSFVSLWNEIFFLSEKNLQVYQIATSLMSRYQVLILSNINILHLEYIKKIFPVFSAFSHFLASCELGIIKPNPAIYRKALRILQTSPAETFYTDDRIELVASARELGMHGFLFESVETLKSDLAACAIDVFETRRPHG